MTFFTVAYMLVSILFFVCYFYQFVYIPIPFLLKSKRKPPAPERGRGPGERRIAVLIAARNEEKVVGKLLESVWAQTYPRENVTAFVAADNCTDSTAALCREAGAVVYERYDREKVGKGYAMDFLLSQVERDYGAFDAYLVLDADNLLDPNYISEMDKTFLEGYEIATSYRNSKNYGDNWISSGYALWFLREAEYLNHVRSLLGISAAVSGTGFMFSRRILERCGGWKFYLLTEDIEFTVCNVVAGERIGYCKDAVLYDEQPVTFRQSWRQRLRWAKGYLQVFRSYGGKLAREIFVNHSFSAFDMSMIIMPAMVLTMVSLVLRISEFIMRLALGLELLPVLLGILSTLGGVYATMFVLGGVTTITQWRAIRASTPRKVLTVFTFPLFMLTYIPISICSFFARAGWKPIEHTKSLSVSDVTKC